MKKRIIIAIVLVLLVGGLCTAYFWPAKEPEAEAQEQQEDEYTEQEEQIIAEIDEMEEDLTVCLDNLADLYEKYSWEFLDSQMPAKDRKRTKAAGFSNAVSFPFKSKDKDKAQKEIYNEILRSPVFADMVARALIDVKVTDSKTIGDLNPWMAEFIEKMDEAMKKDEAPKGNEVWLTKRTGEGDKIFVTSEFREYAAGLCQIHEVLLNQGVQSGLKSSKNWELVSIGVKGSARRTSLAKEQENKDALVFIYKTKSGTIVFKFGYNIRDKRIEFFKNTPVAKPKKPGKPEGKTPSKGTPTGKKNPGKGTPDGKKPGKGKPDGGKPGSGKPDGGKPDGNGGKDKTKDPSNQNNADIGSGKNDDPGPGKKEDKKDTTKPDGDPGKKDNTVVNKGDDDTGYNSGHGPTGTTDKEGDTEDKDKNRPTNGSDNNTPPPAKPITEGGKDNSNYEGGTNTGSETSDGTVDWP